MTKKFKTEEKMGCQKTTEDWNLTGRMIMEHIQCKIIDNAKL
jgi:hypothetical protein